jgi:hypothetical protein
MIHHDGQGNISFNMTEIAQALMPDVDESLLSEARDYPEYLAVWLVAAFKDLDITGWYDLLD